MTSNYYYCPSLTELEGLPQREIGSKEEIKEEIKEESKGEANEERKEKIEIFIEFCKIWMWIDK